MIPASERSPAQRFAAAADRYLTGHQACLACGQRHSVFHRDSADREEYYCYSCEFTVCHDRRNDRYFVWEPTGSSPQVPAVLRELSEAVFASAATNA
jgi:hypothetical protein